MSGAEKEMKWITCPVCLLVNFITVSFGVGAVVYVLSLYYDKIFTELIQRSQEPSVERQS